MGRNNPNRNDLQTPDPEGSSNALFVFIMVILIAFAVGVLPYLKRPALMPVQITTEDQSK